jgi:hypothetical protein
MRIGGSEKRPSLAAKHLLDCSVARVNVDYQIAAAPTHRVFRTVVDSPDDVAVNGTLGNSGRRKAEVRDQWSAGGCAGGSSN